MAYHQMAYVNPWRMVAWKCLSLSAGPPYSGTPLVPVAYASRSPSFFPDLVGPKCNGKTGAVLWVVSAPQYRAKDGWKRAFPPTLTARMAVERVLRGDTVRGWANGSADADLRRPREQPQRERWRRAESIRDPVDRVVFRITRDFARVARRSKKGRGISMEEAWKCVRVAVADRKHSAFLAHIDATEALCKAFALNERVGPTTEERSRKAAQMLMSPRMLRQNCLSCVDSLEKLAEQARKNSIFVSYRWEMPIEDVVDIGLELLRYKYAIWLDRLAIPDFRIKPQESSDAPDETRLKRLLFGAIDGSALFLLLADRSFGGAPAGEPQGKNWAQMEFGHAQEQSQRQGTPRIHVVDLGGAPGELRESAHKCWRYVGERDRILEYVTLDIGQP